MVCKGVTYAKAPYTNSGNDACAVDELFASIASTAGHHNGTALIVYDFAANDDSYTNPPANAKHHSISC
jgi:hypothetical protein